jgi:hypothetical protein
MEKIFFCYSDENTFCDEDCLPAGGRGWFHGSLWRLTTCEGWPEGAPRHQSAASFSSFRLVRLEKLSSQAINSVRGFSPSVLADFAPQWTAGVHHEVSAYSFSQCGHCPATDYKTMHSPHRQLSLTYSNCESFAIKVRGRDYFFSYFTNFCAF